MYITDVRLLKYEKYIKINYREKPFALKNLYGIEKSIKANKNNLTSED